MPTVIDTSFEGTIGDESFFDTSATPPSISSASAFIGAKSLFSSVGAAAQWGRWRFPAPPSTAAFRYYINIADYNQTSHDFSEFVVSNPAQSHSFAIHPKVDGSGNVALSAWFDPFSFALSEVAITEGVWYRVEVKLDWSATNWKATWGTAVGNGALTTHDTNATGGNTLAADTMDHVLFGVNTVANIQVYHDAVKFSNSGADYPLGVAGGAVTWGGQIRRGMAAVS